MTAVNPAIDAPARAYTPIDRSANRIQPLRALKAMGELVKDKENTVQVFEIMRALSGGSTKRSYERLLSTVEGGRQAYARIELAELMSDPKWLAQFGDGTVGAAYREFISSRNISAEGLADESRKAHGREVDARHPYSWLGRRMRDIHDVWHVLTGYSTDALGEACVVAFSYSQTKSLGFGFIALVAGRQFRKAKMDLPFNKAIKQAFENGKAAEWLPQEDYEALFAENLVAARKRLNIKAPTIYQSIPVEIRESMGLKPGMAAMAA